MYKLQSIDQDDKDEYKEIDFLKDVSFEEVI